MEFALLVLAGIGGGLTGAVAGLASLVSYPALLAIGLPPVTANVTNTVALTFNSVGAVWGSRPELVGERRRIVPLGLACLLGGAVGALLLLVGTADVFAKLVPVLIGGASIVILVPRSWWSGRPLPDDAGRIGPRVLAGMFLIGIYGGYFGAAAGVVVLAVLLTAVTGSLIKANGLRNATLGLANGVAAIGFVAFGPVHWAAVVPLSIGFLIGGRIGPALARRLPATPLRVGIALAGLGLAGWLATAAY